MATISLTVPDAQIDRVRAAFGKHLRLGRPATPAEIKAALIDHVRGVVGAKELEQLQTDAAVAAAAQPPIDAT